MSSQNAPGKAALRRAADVLGGQGALAALLGYGDRRNVSPWFTTDRSFPEEHCPAVERATTEKGQPVTVEELRPDLRWVRIKDASWPYESGRPLLDVSVASNDESKARA